MNQQLNHSPQHARERVESRLLRNLPTGFVIAFATACGALLAAIIPALANAQTVTAFGAQQEASQPCSRYLAGFDWHLRLYKQEKHFVLMDETAPIAK